jgi:hypothetical protein
VVNCVIWLVIILMFVVLFTTGLFYGPSPIALRHILECARFGITAFAIFWFPVWVVSIVLTNLLQRRLPASGIAIMFVVATVVAFVGGALLGSLIFLRYGPPQL